MNMVIVLQKRNLTNVFFFFFFSVFVIFLSFVWVAYLQYGTNVVFNTTTLTFHPLQNFSLCLFVFFFSPVQTQGITVCSADPGMTYCNYPAHCVNTTSNVSCVCAIGYADDPPQCVGESKTITICMVKELDLLGFFCYFSCPHDLKLLN